MGLVTSDRLHLWSGGKNSLLDLSGVRILYLEHSRSGGGGGGGWKGTTYLVVKDLLCMGTELNGHPSPRSGEKQELGKGSITANHRSASLTFPSHTVCVVQKEDLPLIFQCPLLDWRHRADFFNFYFWCLWNNTHTQTALSEKVHCPMIKSRRCCALRNLRMNCILKGGREMGKEGAGNLSYVGGREGVGRVCVKIEFFIFLNVQGELAQCPSSRPSWSGGRSWRDGVQIWTALPPSLKICV